MRAIDFSDDRLGGVLRRLSDDHCWFALEADLWLATVVVHQIELAGVRLDSTTSYGHHQPQDEGLMQYGHSKDHRPDLAQLKLMAAAAEPCGHLIASDVHSGQRADDLLYIPLIQRLREILRQNGLLYTGDCKMAALAIRGEIAAHQDYYLMPLALTGNTAQDFETWVNAAVEGVQITTLIWDAKHLLGGGYEFERQQTATVDNQEVTWTERVQIVRSLSLAQRLKANLEERLGEATTQLLALTPSLGRGRRQIRSLVSLQEQIAQVLQRYRVNGLLVVSWQRLETSVTRYRGRGRGGPNRATSTKVQVRYSITEVQRQSDAIALESYRLGWRVQVTNAPANQLTLSQAVCHYRGGWCLERDFHLVKDLPLGLSPLFVCKDDQIKGLTRLLTVALRLLTFIEIEIRQGLRVGNEAITGLYEGQPKRETERPTGKRILKAFARDQITLTRVEVGNDIHYHVTPLPPLHQKLLGYLKLPESLYTALAKNS
ncbi:MAG: transposase [Cyanobacteria bacterium CRU_2_1]|nr:transposase [Cyanobacteria bacterium CRU_2_1]